MATFEYIARDRSGQEKAGLIQADSEAAVVRTLSQQALFPVRILPQAITRRRGGRGGRIKLRHLGVTYSQLADLLSSGVPMLRCLEILSRTAVNPALGRVLEAVRDSVAGGETLADAMGEHPAVFSELHVAMVHAGEHAGFLEEVLTNLAGFLDRQDELRSKVRGAMIYPVVLAVLGTLVLTILLLFIVPKFKDFLAGESLPLPSRMLFSLSDALRYHAVMVGGGVLLVGLLAGAYVRSEGGRRRWSRVKLRLPLAGRAVRMVAITRFCRVLGTMLANGVAILQALSISKGATGNELMAGAIEAAAENVRAGEPLAEPLRRSGLFPLEIIEMIAVGEESNQLEKVLIQVADAAERRTNRQVDAAVRLIEPLMLVVMACGVGFVAVGLLYPIFTAARSLR